MSAKPPDNTSEQQQQQAKPGEGGAAAGGAAAGGATQAGGTQQQQAAAPAPAQQQAATQQQGAPSEPRIVGADDEVRPGETVRMTHDALKARNSRASRAFLKETFGTDDPTVIKNKLADADKLAKEADDKRRAEMAEIDRLKEDNNRLLTRATNAEALAQELQEAQELAGDEVEIRTVAERHIDPEYWDVAKAKLGTFLADTYTAEELDAMPEAKREEVVDQFFADYVKKKPALARNSGGQQQGGGTQQQQQQQEVVRRPLQTGGPNTRGKGDPKPPPVIKGGKFDGKTVAPGHPNSMTAAEYKEWQKATGNNY